MLILSVRGIASKENDRQGSNFTLPHVAICFPGSMCWLACVSFSVVSDGHSDEYLHLGVLLSSTDLYVSLWIGTILILLLEFSDMSWILEKQYLQHYSFSLKIALVILDPFCFHKNFRIFFFYLWRMLWVFWSGMHSICILFWGDGHFHNINSMFIMSHEHMMSFHFLVLRNWSA